MRPAEARRRLSRAEQRPPSRPPPGLPHRTAATAPLCTIRPLRRAREPLGKQRTSVGTLEGGGNPI
jgi:hypothetical protein